MELNTYYLYIPGFAAVILLFILTLNLTIRKHTTLTKKPFLYFLPIILIILLTLITYLFSRALRAEYFFEKSLKSRTIKEIYDYQRLAIITNPNKDTYRIRFSQTNLLIANSLADKAKAKNEKPANIFEEMSPEDRQTATKAIQAAIEEAKAAVKLNDKKAANWANLANIYKNLLNLAEKADTWSISAYQRAIVLDPNNPNYYLELGGVYYLLKNYDEAIKMFKTAIRLNPNWPNAYYNLAWTFYQRGEKAEAVSNMETTISLLSQQDNPSELSKAQKDLEEFKKMTY